MVTHDPAHTLMVAEARQSSAAVARFLDVNAARLTRLGERLRARPPAVVVTCARGSSDHAASYGKYVIETLTGTPVASQGLSTATLFPPVPSVVGTDAQRLCIAVSQSGKSPDLLAAVTAQRDAGAFVVALVNEPDAPLAALAHETLALSAGPERSVAATKSYIVSLAALAALTAAWTGDQALQHALRHLPAMLDEAVALDWSAGVPVLRDARNLFVLGRGYSLGIAQEAALKLKETCGLHGEAFSSAEVKHGPMALIGEGFPLIAFAGSDRAGDDVRAAAALFSERGARMLLADSKPGAETAAAGVIALPALAAHPVLEPLLMIQSFYPMAAAVSLARGHDPDQPPFLNKVTRTT